MHRTATHSLAGTLSAPSAGILLPRTLAGTSTAEWLSSLGGSPRLLHPLRDLLYGRNSLVGYAVSWYSTTSVAHAKVRSAPITGHPARVNALPLSRFGRGISLRHPATVVLALVSVGACAVQNPFFCLGEPAEGFLCPCTSLCWFSSWLFFPMLSSPLV